MQQMGKDEALRFLASGSRTGKLATVRTDGRPHIAPIWFVVNGNNLIFTTWHATVKAANIRRDPRVSLCVDDEQPPFAFVIVEGTAAIVDDLTALREWATRIAARYMGDDQAEAFGIRNGVPGELLIRLTPTRIIAQAGIAD